MTTYQKNENQMLHLSKQINNMYHPTNPVNTSNIPTDWTSFPIIKEQNLMAYIFYNGELTLKEVQDYINSNEKVKKLMFEAAIKILAVPERIGGKKIKPIQSIIYDDKRFVGMIVTKGNLFFPQF